MDCRLKLTTVSIDAGQSEWELRIFLLPGETDPEFSFYSYSGRAIGMSDVFVSEAWFGNDSELSEHSLADTVPAYFSLLLPVGVSYSLEAELEFFGRDEENREHRFAFSSRLDNVEVPGEYEIPLPESPYAPGLTVKKTSVLEKTEVRVFEMPVKRAAASPAPLSIPGWGILHADKVYRFDPQSENFTESDISSAFFAGTVYSCFSPSGRAALFMQSGRERLLEIIDLNLPEKLLRLPLSQLVYSDSFSLFSDDGRYLVYPDNRSINLLETTSGRMVYSGMIVRSDAIERCGFFFDETHLHVAGEEALTSVELKSGATATQRLPAVAENHYRHYNSPARRAACVEPLDALRAVSRVSWLDLPGLQAGQLTVPLEFGARPYVLDDGRILVIGRAIYLVSPHSGTVKQLITADTRRKEWPLIESRPVVTRGGEGYRIWFAGDSPWWFAEFV